jgi:hypothetical protein
VKVVFAMKKVLCWSCRHPSKASMEIIATAGESRLVVSSGQEQCKKKKPNNKLESLEIDSKNYVCRKQ